MNKKFNLLNGIGLCFKYAPAACIINILLNIMNGILPPVMVFIVAGFIDSAVSLASDSPKKGLLIISVVLMLSGYLYTQLSQVLLRLTVKSMETQLRNKLRPLIVKKQASLDFTLMEDNNTLDLLTIVCSNTEAKLIAILSAFTAALGLSIQIIGVLIIIVSYVWWILLVFLFGAVPMAILSYRGGAKVYEMDKKSSRLTRMHHYLTEVLSGREAAAERTLFGYSEGINEKFKDIHLKRSNLVTKEIAFWMTREKACGIILNLFTLAALLALISQVSGGFMTSGLYISVAGAMINLSRIISLSLADLLYNMSGHIAYMKDFTRFWALPDDSSVLEHNPMVMPFESLEIKDLWFRYKDNEEYVLKGVNLCIEKGKTYSLIGKNGAGKTTLTKIITGLYRNFEGEIKLNGRNIRDYGVDELRSIFSIIYQDYARYYISLKENIVFGEEADDFKKVSELTGLDSVINKLPLGEDTPLGKIFEKGEDVSGGEWQKIAIARAVYRNCPFMILDEPTASLSPMMESRIYNKFAEISCGCTQLLISHRLGSTKLADTLLVLEDGIIAEEGSHNELIARNRLYAEMFESQRSWYDEKE